ncbi:ABC transporter substrate-binding protein [Thiothrix nivea]|uniref:Sulfonate ABC transporter periplasmic sulfonate-binding protein n=1 Tax=Thiothrix nivea (strain ATCC 35100 / DSM 5205 / JP2) TaxID=870187 RepID=A0A656HIQ4_THINJ|nr:ABC transporter substrate-binding protein [Thiothrix nivea]EIJ34885.1 sulfonate ABC transporter periplasmic sulfonate-binding protein [Thiothrix nivea DSM 5205]
MHHSLRPWLIRCATLLSLLAGLVSPAFALEKVRVGVLEFGTVNWEMDTLKYHKLDEQNGIELDIMPLASADASTVALQGGAVDIIVSDWVWVARQRAAGQDYTLFPYSNAVGAVMVKPDSGIKTLADLKGKKLGVAGGPSDKSWLLLRAYAKQTAGLDLQAEAEPQFAAPPLLNELMQRGDLDAVLNFWHYAARLQAAGMQPFITVPDVVKGLGIDSELPLVGWVFSEKWANGHPDIVKGFLSADYAAKQILKESDTEWERLRPRMKAESDTIFTQLRDGFRAGIPICFGDREKQAAANTFKILAETGGETLLGTAKPPLDNQVFWSGFGLPACAE